jgi:enterochelin esterase-like enzyme
MPLQLLSERARGGRAFSDRQILAVLGAVMRNGARSEFTELLRDSGLSLSNADHNCIVLGIRSSPPRRRAVVWLVAIGLPIVVAIGITAGVVATRSDRVSTRIGTPTGHVSVLRVKTSTGAQRGVWIYRPAVPDSSTLPVVYFLHGVPGSAADIFHGGIAAQLDAAIKHGAAPFVLVSPDGNGAHHNDTEWADAFDGTDTIESDFIHNVIPAVEGTAPRDRAHRAIAGFSMGGYGAMNLAERHPTMFGQVVSISGYFHIDDPDEMFGNELDQKLANQPDQHVATLAHTRVLLLEGASDDEPVVKGEAARFNAVLDAARIPHTFRIDPGSHHWTFVVNETPKWVAFLERGWSARR